MAWTIPWNLIGLSVSGDFGDTTIYTNRRGKKVTFPRSPPTKPPSPLQQHQRARFRQAQANWAALTPQQQRDWELVTMKASLCLTGQNLAIHYALLPEDDFLVTLERQTGIALTRPPKVPP